MDDLTGKSRDAHSLNRLSWGLVIPTYGRPQILVRSVRLAVAQTRRPSTVVIVDSHPDSARHKDELLSELGATHSSTPIHYLTTTRRSSSFQRNIGIDFINTDLVFLFDDDTLMFPDCAEQLVLEFEADTNHTIAGLNPKTELHPPDITCEPSINSTPNGTLLGRLASSTRRIFKAEDLFQPYLDRTGAPSYASDQSGLIGLGGFKMTFRTESIRRTRFNDLLLGYCPGEDTDASHRVLRYGRLENCASARVHHLGQGSGRPDYYQRSMIGNLNSTFCHRLFAHHWPTSLRAQSRLLRRRTLLALLSDLRYCRGTLPRFRGTLTALWLSQTFRGEQLRPLIDWYNHFQSSALGISPLTDAEIEASLNDLDIN